MLVDQQKFLVEIKICELRFTSSHEIHEPKKDAHSQNICESNFCEPQKDRFTSNISHEPSEPRLTYYSSAELIITSKTVKLNDEIRIIYVKKTLFKTI